MSSGCSAPRFYPGTVPSPGPNGSPFQWANLTVRSKARSGAYGDVYLAHDHYLDCAVALKLYHDRPADG